MVAIAHETSLDVCRSLFLVHVADSHCFASLVLFNRDVELHDVVDEVVLRRDMKHQRFLGRITHVRLVVQTHLFKQVQCKACLKVVLQCTDQNKLPTTEATLITTHSVNALPARTKHTVSRQFILGLFHQRLDCIVVIDVYRVHDGRVGLDGLYRSQRFQVTDDIFNEVLPVDGVWIEQSFLRCLLEDLSDLVLVEVRLKLRTILQHHTLNEVQVFTRLCGPFESLIQGILVRYVYTYSLK
ncbi:hypothetical protein D3C84_693810 [compost metagenome]